MKKPRLLQEFQAFAFKGNVIDLAVAVVMGTAFLAVVNSLVKHVLMPALSYILPGNAYRQWKIGNIEIGEFVGEFINFLLVAIAMFLLIVKVRDLLRKRGPLSAAPEPAATKECPMCASSIPAKAKRCPHCTSDLP